MECKNCGSSTDPILSECQYCGSPIKGVDLTSIPTEDIIRYTNKWVGIMEDLPIGGVATRTNDNSQHMFDTVTTITRDEINSNVKEYLGLLDIRADKDALANRKFPQLKQDYKDAVDNFEKRRKRVIMGLSIVTIAWILLIIILAT